MPNLVSQTIIARVQLLSETVIARQYEIQPDLSQRDPGLENAAVLAYTGLTLRNLAQALALESPALFSDYISWLKVYLESREVPVRDLRINLHCLQQVLTLHFGREEGNILAEYLDAARAELEKTMPYLYTTELRGEYAGLAHDYLSALLVPDQERAVFLLTSALENGLINLTDIYLRVLQPVQHELGRLWQFNQLDPLQAQAATAITSAVVDRLAACCGPIQYNGLTLLVGFVPDEQHTLAARMLAGYFASAGWRVICPPSSLTAAQTVDLVNSQQIPLLALSVTQVIHLNALRELIADVRAGAPSSLRILVGGAPFNLVPFLWRRVGADGSATDPESALRLAQSLFISA